MAKTNDKINNLNDQAGSIFDKINDKTNNNTTNTSDYSQAEIMSFNSSFELYNGTQSEFFVSKLLEKVVTNNKTKKDHLITVVYNETTTNVADDITSLKQNLEDGKDYEVSLDYDTDGFVNKVTIQ